MLNNCSVGFASDVNLASIWRVPRVSLDKKLRFHESYVRIRPIRDREIGENLNSEIRAKLNRVSLHRHERSPLSLEHQPFQSRLLSFDFGRFHALYLSND